ncbi:MAG: hypothetical protein IT290_06460 [Deltaproteobacteria bacterium]|nr:hypothetical protein [Deltaproteobacteria bacterium]
MSATKYRELFSDYYGEPDDGVATNGLNLYRVRSADIFRTARELRDEALIGISCGAADAQRLRTRHGLDPSEVNVQHLRDTEWTFLGYDVADEWLLSGLSNCGLGRDQSADTKSQYNAEMNSLGLFASAHAAERFAHFLDARVTEHAPFSVYGIWRR